METITDMTPQQAHEILRPLVDPNLSLHIQYSLYSSGVAGGLVQSELIEGWSIFTNRWSYQHESLGNAVNAVKRLLTNAKQT